MIVNGGLLRSLDQLIDWYETLEFGLFTDNQSESRTVVWSDLVEATWTGYVRSPVSSLVASAIDGVRAVTRPYTDPTFTNTSGSTQNFYGWFLIDTADDTLVAFVNLTAQTILNGETRTINPRMTYKEE